MSIKSLHPLRLLLFTLISLKEPSVCYRIIRKLFEKTTIILFLFCSLLISFPFVSCEKALLKPDPGDDPIELFNHLWNDVNNRYAYFELKDIDWDSLGLVYRGKIQPGTSEKELFEILGDMLYELKDGHVNLLSHFDRSRNWEWFHNFPLNYDQNIIDRDYLKDDYRITGPLHNQTIDSILYVNYRSFSEKISSEHLDHLMDQAKDLKGVIIDIRNNGGGSIQNGYALSSCFTSEKVVFAHQRFKTGPGDDEFTSWENLTINPRDGERFEGPVVVLTNRRSYSASTFFAQMMRVIPHATLIGDHTGGGGGVPVYGELSNGWTYRFSASQALTPEGEHMENQVTVDIKVDMLSNDESRGVDTIIETALAYIAAQTIQDN